MGPTSVQQMDHLAGLVDLHQICRLCRTPKGVMSYIFSCSGTDTSSPLSERIMKFANVQMKEDDGLPNLICHRCLYHIERVNEFKLLCEESDIYLRQHLASQVENGCTLLNEKQNLLNGLGHDRYEDNSEWIKKEPTEEIQNAVSKDNESHSDNEDTELNCPSCNKHFENSAQLDRHVLIHSQEGPYPCDFCDVVEKDKASLRAHWKEHAGQYSNVCQTCGDTFDSKEALLKHNLRHDKAKPYHCDVCQKAFSYKSDLRKHSIIHTGLRPYVCHICCKSFTRSTNLNKHAKLHSGRRPFACSNCDKMFASKGDLIRHAVIHTGEKPYSCSVCSISFNRRDKLTRHEKVHLGGRPHPCSECPTSFNRKEELTKHYQFHHFSPDMFLECGSPISADLTMYKTESNTPLDSEDGGETEAVVINVDPAHWAGEQVTTKKNNGTSDKDRPFSCDTCQKRFMHRRELNRHSAVHTGIRPFSCFTCGKTFVRSDKLKRHLLTHTNKRFQCSSSPPSTECYLCGKVLSSKQELKRHIMIHSEVKPYQCNHCFTSYCRRDKLVKHIKRFHSNTMELENVYDTTALDIKTSF